MEEGHEANRPVGLGSGPRPLRTVPSVVRPAHSLKPLRLAMALNALETWVPVSSLALGGR